MSKRLVFTCTMAVVLLLVSGMAFAGVPCAGTTTLTATGTGVCAPGAAVCPLGDLQTVDVTVTVRDCYGTPLAGQLVDISGSAVTGNFCFCTDPVTAGPTDALGQATATFADFGGCGDLEFYGTIGTVVAGPSAAITIGSPDANGDCTVDLVDFSTFATNYFTTSTCSDYNCDGLVDLVDFSTFATHYFHTCTP